MVASQATVDRILPDAAGGICIGIPEADPKRRRKRASVWDVASARTFWHGHGTPAPQTIAVIRCRDQTPRSSRRRT